MDYIIPLNGWAAGERAFRWQADTKFFQKFENTEILDATVGIEAKAVKSGHYIGVDLDITGTVTVACDRCLEDLTLPVEAHPAFSVKFGTGAPEGEEEMREGSREILCPGRVRRRSGPFPGDLRLRMPGAAHAAGSPGRGVQPRHRQVSEPGARGRGGCDDGQPVLRPERTF